MGNEMGNSNASGFQEEENSTTQVQEKPLQEAGDADGAEVEKHNASSLAEVKDYHEKDNGMATDVLNAAAETQVANHTSNEGEEKETQPLAESPKVEVKSNSSGAIKGSSEMKPNYVSNDSKDHEKPHSKIDGEGENLILPVAEGKDFNGKEINGFPFGFPKEAVDPHIGNQILDGRETEDLALAESPKFEVSTDNEAASEISDSQPDSPSKNLKDHEMQQESDLTENLSQISDHQLENQTSIKKEEVGTEITISETINSSEVQNQNAPLAEIEDYHENDNEVATDVLNGAADPHVVNHISNEREEKETQPLAESPKVEVKSNSTGASEESSEMKPNYISNGSKDHEKPHSNTDGEGENHIIPVAEGKAFNKREIDSLPFGFPKEAADPHIGSQISDGRETEDLAPAESPKFEVSTDNEAASEISDSQPTSPSKHLKDHEMQQESNLTENLLQISDHQLEKQASIKKEEEGTANSTSEMRNSSDDPDPQDSEDSKIDRCELTKTPSDPPIQDSNRSLHSHEEILGSNLNCTSAENAHLIGTKILEDMDQTVVTGSNLEVEVVHDDLTVKERVTEEVSHENRLAIKDEGQIGNGFGGKPMLKSVFPDSEGFKCNGAEIINIDSLKAESEVNFMDESPILQIGISESIDKFIFLAAETILTEKESKHVENKSGDCLTRSCEEPVKESKTDTANLSQPELLIFENEGENKQKRIADFTCYGVNQDCTEEAKLDENGHLLDKHIEDQSEGPMEHSKDSQEEAEMVPESGIVSTESSLTDCEGVEVPEERQIIEEIERTEASYGTENNAEGRHHGDQCMSPVEQEEVSLPKILLSLVQHEDNQHNHSILSPKIESSNDSISELKQESNVDFLVTEASCFDSKNLMVETSVSVAELAAEKPEQDLSWHTENAIMVAAEANTQVNNVNEQCAKVEMPAIASDDYQVQESAGRLSTESNSNNLNTQVQMQKSPSFGLDLRIEARTEESDRTPLLWQDKTATEDFSDEQEVSLSSPIVHTHYDQDKLQYQAMPVEEKVVRMEIRSDSEKSKTPFFGFLKEEEEVPFIVTQQKHEDINAAVKKVNKDSLNLDTKEVAATSKEKRKPRTSLFSTCICCTTVIN